MNLTKEHIDYIIKDLNYRGIVIDEIRDELIDHICSAVELKMKTGVRFVDAYQLALKTFGFTTGLQVTQKQTIQFQNLKTPMMLKNYFTIGWRNLLKQKFYSVINIAGLAIGIATCLIMALFIADELSYDKYNTKADRIYRVEADVKFGGNEFQMTFRSAPEAHALLNEYPEVESVVRFRKMGSYLVKPASGTENIKELNVIWADSTFFKIFSVDVLEGNAKTALAEPSSVAISRKMAEKYFPGTSAIGQSIILDNKYHATVTAVYENIPHASHFHFDIIVSMIGDWPIAREAKSTSFMSENFNTYLLLKPGTDAKALESKLSGFLDKYMGPQITQSLGNDFTMEKFRASGNWYNLSLRPLTDIHLYANLKGEFEPNGNIAYVYLMSLVAAFILIIGCINFMNLSTARSGSRAKEVGLRKVMGSLRSHLVKQFLTESILITLISVLLAVVLSYFFLPVFNTLSQKQIQIPFSNPTFYVILFLGCLVIGLMAGLYPSFFLSAFKPIQVLKGQVSLGMKSGTIRSALVVFQFVISIFLTVGAVSVDQQFQFIQNKKLGFEKDQVIIIHDAYALRPNNVNPFKEEALKLNSIEAGTVSGFVPVENDWVWRSNNSIWMEGKEPSPDNLVSSQEWAVDYDYINTFQMKMVQGRAFSEEFPSDKEAVILNETSVRRLGIESEPIGKKVSLFDGPASPEYIRTYEVIGVVEDFHFTSLKENITALAIRLGKSDGSVCFRFMPDRAKETIQSLKKIWESLAPGQPFQYSFLDEEFANMYRYEERLGTIFTLFAGLAILIACLGLFALTAFTTEQRTKEIGIRKVMGASIQSIVLLLSKEFGKLIIIAFVLATPIAWIAIDWWLRDYTYKIEISWIVFALAGIVVLAIALATMSYQSIKAASANPIDSLRNE